MTDASEHHAHDRRCAVPDFNHVIPTGDHSEEGGGPGGGAVQHASEPQPTVPPHPPLPRLSLGFQGRYPKEGATEVVKLLTIGTEFMSAGSKNS